jgi:hypothetical protein
MTVEKAGRKFAERPFGVTFRNKWRGIFRVMWRPAVVRDRGLVVNEGARRSTREVAAAPICSLVLQAGLHA